jgi:hypothetical protein
MTNESEEIGPKETKKGPGNFVPQYFIDPNIFGMCVMQLDQKGVMYTHISWGRLGLNKHPI